ncbi:hypothetical protein CK203_048508 [Vitis vinifera]|uniref:R13L1/DRL21-like LRR repeat region domain-containing protein n=1 Tax=Vitis vinifera TaxID=29760 RepID=A0A438FX75_VITVI|nr:hypothetical protein CK203_048508 [Vitis vinifera]
MPHGIGELTLLQSLPLFVVGEERELSRDHTIGSLIELKRLNQLRGGLLIKNLQNARVSEGEILKEKECLESLRLEWAQEGNCDVDDELGMFKMPNSTTLFSTPTSPVFGALEYGRGGGHERGFINNKCRILPSSSIPQLNKMPKLKGLWRMGAGAEQGLSSSSF